jgi:hypothetical protein
MEDVTMKNIALGVIAIALATPAVAGDKPVDAKARKPHLICKRDQDSATRMSKAVCKTAAEWAGTSVDEDQAAIDTISRQQTTLDGGPLVGPGGRPGPSPN